MDDSVPPLEALAARHEAEERQESQDRLTLTPRPMRTLLPAGGRLPRSGRWLDRLYAGERVVREKKPPVVDHLRSAGPWLVSVDTKPMSVLDAMSQTSTLCDGFAMDRVVASYFAGDFDDTLLVARERAPSECPHARAYARALASLVPGLDHVAFAHSGAEANEKALALCRLAAPPSARRILAFEGSFHGRTLLSLHATWNPVKRAPYEIDPGIVEFLPFPAAADGRTGYEAILERAAEHLATGDFFACLVEPMQSEGGDRYADAAFFRGLRQITREHGVALILDEVQTGFHLGDDLLWHRGFELPEPPDAVTLAKRAQLGVVLSRFEDPDPLSAPAASMIRGRLYLEEAGRDDFCAGLSDELRHRLDAIAEGHPELVGAPRVCGQALAFDLPTPDHMRRYLGQRFYRGAVVFGAGQRTIRYRLTGAFHARSTLDRLFETIDHSLSWLEEHPGEDPPAWVDSSFVHQVHDPPDGVRVRVASPAEADELMEAVVALEDRVYEPARRDPPDKLRLGFRRDGVAVVAEARSEDGWTLVGHALAAPLELFETVDGPDRDRLRGRETCLYSIAQTVDSDWQGRGIGGALKAAQIEAAELVSDGRIRFVCGRNRVGLADHMTRLNRRVGAYVVAELDNQYGEPDGRAVYYRIPVGAWAPDAAEPEPVPANDLSDGVARPLSKPPESLLCAQRDGSLYGPAVHKLTLVNYTTRAIVRATEWIDALEPRLGHLYLTSSRDELIDKSLRLLRTHRKGATVAIGVEGGYVGHTSAAARSLSDPATHRHGGGAFDWPRVPHPEAAGADATVRALDACLAQRGGPDAILALVVEAVGSRTGRSLDASSWAALCAWRARTGVPLVLVETSTACYRSAAGPFACSELEEPPDLLAWWGGGHTAMLHCSDALYVSKPLTLVSTWDGDELSLVRLHHQLRAARRLRLGPACEILDRLASALDAAGRVSLRGRGLYRVLDPGAERASVDALLARENIRLRPLSNGRLAVVPCLDAAEPAVAHLADTLRELVR